MLHIKFQASEPSGSSEEDFRIFFCVILWFEPRTPGHQGRLENLGLDLNKVGKRPLGHFIPNLASQPICSEEEDFQLSFYVFLWFEPRTPWSRAILDPGTFI